MGLKRDTKDRIDELVYFIVPIWCTKNRALLEQINGRMTMLVHIGKTNEDAFLYMNRQYKTTKRKEEAIDQGNLARTHASIDYTSNKRQMLEIVLGCIIGHVNW